MAINFSKTQNGITLVPQNTISPSIDGDLRYNSSTNKVELFNGSVDPIVTEADTATLTNKSIDATTNTITNLSNTNLNGSAAITNANLAQMPSDTIKANLTGGSATPSDVSTSALATAIGAITSLTGDVTGTGPGATATTLATVTTPATVGSSTAIPVITYNAKGLVTNSTTAAVIAPAGTLTGTTLASNVVSSSLTSVGTITSGTWNGTPVTVPFGGTGDTSFTAYAPVIGGTTTTGALQSAASGISNVGFVLTSTGSGSAPTWQGSGSFVNINARYDTATSGTVSSTPTIVKYTNQDFDTNSAYSSSTGNFTAPNTGKYRISAAFLVTGATVHVNDFYSIYIFHNGSTYSQVQGRINSTSVPNQSMQISDTVNAISGDTISIQVAAQGVTTPSLVGNSPTDWIAIEYAGS